MHYFPTQINRRTFLKRLGGGLVATLSMANLLGCTRHEPVVRIATNVWPGYELMYLARELGYFLDAPIRMIEMPSSTVSLQALAAGSIEGAGLTLDETLTAIADGIDLKIVAVLDISMGADVLLSKPGITDLHKLKGKRIGVEQSAVGAVMLAAVLKRAQLAPHEIQQVPLEVNEHRNAYLQNRVDALITFEPVGSQLLQEKANKLFSSADIPGQIIDVLAVRPDVLLQSPHTIRTLIAGHFYARTTWLQNPSNCAPILARRLNVAPALVATTYQGLELPDLASNKHWLTGTPPQIELYAQQLNQIMAKSDLLSKIINTKKLANPNFLGET